MFIEFGHLEIKLLIPILFPIFLKLRRLNREINEIKSYAFQGFNDFLSLTICGLLYLISKFISKSEKGKIVESQNEKSNKKTNNLSEAINIQIEMQNLVIEREKKQKRK